MMKDKIRNFVVVYLLLPLSIMVSGVLTYRGIISIYPDPDSFIKILIMFLILVYAGMLYLFWGMWGEFLSLLNKKITDYIKVFILSIIVVILVFTTSTIFNIVYLSGPVAVNREIAENVLKIRVNIKYDIENRKRNLINQINSFKKYLNISKSNKKSEESSGKYYMYYSYQDTSTRISSVISELNDKYYSIKNNRGNSPNKVIEQYLSENSYQKEDTLKYDMFSTAIDIIEKDLVTDDESIDSELNTIGLSLPSSLGGIISNSNAETSNIDEKEGKNKFNNFANRSQQAIKNLEIIKAITRDSVEIKHRKFNMLINKIQTIMIEKEASSYIDVGAYKDLLSFSNAKLEKFNTLPFYKSSSLNTRKETLYKTLYNDLSIHLEKLINSTSRSQEFNYSRYKLNDIFYTVFDPKYRELPLITFAFFIDFIPILLMVLASIIFGVKTRDTNA